MIVDVRHISHDLSPPGLAMFGLYTTFDAFVGLINNTKEIEIVINHQEDAPPLNEKVELALFRVLTQLIANTIKHAEATKIEIDLIKTDQQLKITYTDNGKGFDIVVLNAKKGIGMQNIQSRLQMSNATYIIETEPNKGFKMMINCPFEPAVLIN